ncbi:glutamate-5-semialdehyde dehydrogenase [Myxococcota bacterium]|nr:glutamate-5-semialdehyde dehydrogenase [Myxococcota bacterium]MBU1429942.1 glutamate-5-semialdehyde dehydrogenase [Myxococcota bacterium]MBU1899045.1 glutamate-5-semialdehyde dehydrogenase [Myxococcota bacterium]
MSYEQMEALGRRGRAASRALAKTPGRIRDAALLAMADALAARREAIKAANALDLADADARGVTGAMRDRLKLDDARIDAMIAGLREVVALPDPVGEVLGERVRPNGLRVAQMRMPLGVIGIIYEARPNVTVDAAALCIKSGNVAFLRGGSEAKHSNALLIEILRAALEGVGLPGDALMSLPSTDRAWIEALLQAEPWIDVIIPRGGESLIRFVTARSRIPVIKHYKGVCHIFIDATADWDKAIEICHNAKVQRPGVCNAMETLLIHEAIAPELLPMIAERLSADGVELRGCPAAREILPSMAEATEEDYHAEYLDLILAVRIVADLDEAMDHIATYGSDHTESILSEDYSNVQRFLEEVRSAVVMANASTRFSDGGQMGLGAEIGISTTRLHAYGPMGLEDLTCKKYIVKGTGQTRG